MSKEELEAGRLIKKYSYYTDGYVGSSQMTFTEYPDVKLRHTKELVREVIKDLVAVELRDSSPAELKLHNDFYTKVLKHVEEYEEQVCELCDKSVDVREMRLESEESNWICNNCINSVKSEK